MADQTSSGTDDQAALETFVKDRQTMLGGFTSATTWSIGAIVVLLILMRIFLM